MPIKVFGLYPESNGTPLLGFIWRTIYYPSCRIKTKLGDTSVGDIGSQGYLLGGHWSRTAEKCQGSDSGTASVWIPKLSRRWLNTRGEGIDAARFLAQVTKWMVVPFIEPRRQGSCLPHSPSKTLMSQT